MIFREWFSALSFLSLSLSLVALSKWSAGLWSLRDTGPFCLLRKKKETKGARPPLLIVWSTVVGHDKFATQEIVCPYWNLILGWQTKPCDPSCQMFQTQLNSNYLFTPLHSIYNLIRRRGRIIHFKTSFQFTLKPSLQF